MFPRKIPKFSLPPGHPLDPLRTRPRVHGALGIQGGLQLGPQGGGLQEGAQQLADGAIGLHGPGTMTGWWFYSWNNGGLPSYKMLIFWWFIPTPLVGGCF